MIDTALPDDTELLALEGLTLADGLVVYRSGSLVEGLGNARSDVDVYVVGASAPNGAHVIRKETHDISIHHRGARRIDFEYWRTDHIAEIARSLSALRIGEEFLADRLSDHDLLFIHRLRIGEPIGADAAFRRLQETFDFTKFSALLTQQAIHRIDGAMEDVIGMQDSGDLDSAVLRARDLIGHAIDASCFNLGDTTFLPKWRKRVLDRYPNHPFAAELWSLYLPQGRSLRTDLAARAQYLDDCLRQAETVVTWIQS